MITAFDHVSIRILDDVEFMAVRAGAWKEALLRHAKGPVKGMSFHPSRRSPILLTGDDAESPLFLQICRSHDLGYGTKPELAFSTSTSPADVKSAFYFFVPLPRS